MKTKSLIEYEPPVRRQFGLLTRALLILPPAFLLSLKYDLPYILILTVLMVVFPIFQERSFRLRDRPVVYSLLAAGVLAVLPGLFVKIPDERLTFSDYLMRSHQFLPFLLYSAAISCWFMRTREVSALCMLVVLLSCLACGDVYNTSRLVNVSFAGTTPLLRHYRETYLVCTVLQCVGTLQLLTADARYDAVDPLRSVRIFRSLAFILLIPALWTAASIFLSGDDILREWRSHLQHSFQSSSRGRAAPFPSESVIREPQFGPDTPVRVVMRAIAPSEPGYLRGNAYHRFSGIYGGVWTADEKNREDLLEIIREEDRNLTVLTFQLQDSGDSDSDRMEFRFESGFRSMVTPLPANATSVTLDAKSAAVTSDGALVAENWNPSAGVIVTFRDPDAQAAWQDPSASRMADGAAADPGPDPSVRQDYLALSPVLAEQLAGLTPEIFGDADPMSLPQRKRIDAVKRFLSDNFTYSLIRDDYIPQRGEYFSPLMRFLFRTRTGHCELFATSAALLLRLYGVPTRYVNGVVCRRWNPAGYFFATNFDFHAWTEAWLDDERRWVLVEATPAGTENEALLALEEGSWFRTLRDRVALYVDNVVYWFRRGYPAQVVILAWDAAYSRTLDHVKTHPVRFAFELLLPLAFVTAIVLYLRNRRRKRCGLARRLRILASVMRSLQLAVWRKTGVRREPWQTYAAWAKNVDDPALTGCVALYERIRYAGQSPRPEDVEAFERAVEDVRRHPPRKRA